MNPQSRDVFLDRYALRDSQGNPLEHEYTQLAHRLATKFKRNGNDQLRYFDMLETFNFVPGGRILSAGGKDTTLFNCFVIPIEASSEEHGSDSRRAIMDTTSNLIEIAARGGGVGINWSVLRPKSSYIAGVNGRSSGAIAWMRGVDSMADQIRQGGTRTAALMWMLDDWHPDIQEFIHLAERFKRANFSVGISNRFMHKVEKDESWHTEFPDITCDDYDKNWNGNLHEWAYSGHETQVHDVLPARQIFNQIAQSASQIGSPGLVFLDTCQNMSNTWYLDRIVGTNPCVTGDTLVQTVEGQIPIKDLAGQEIDVYCVDEGYNLTISKAKNIRRTKRNASLVRVVTTKGAVVCTPDHEFYTKNRGYVSASELKVTDNVVALNKSPQNEHYAKVYLTGKSARVTGEHRFIAQHYYGDLTDLDVHHIDGNKLNNALSNLEVIRHSDHSVISNVGHPDWCERDEITGRFLPKLSNAKRRDLSNSLRVHPVGMNMHLIEVISLNYTEDVYDLEVEGYHNFFANHVLIHNCGEQPLPPNGSCNLGSVNLNKMWNDDDSEIDLWKLNKTVGSAVRFMDRVTDLSKDVLKSIGDYQRGTRRIGIGTMGLADVLIKAEIRYGSAECIKFIDKVYSMIQTSAYTASCNLAVEFGEAPFLDREKFLNGGFIKTLPARIKNDIDCVGIRNLALLSQAPTGSTGILAEASSGIEPIFSSEYIRTDATGTHRMTHPAFENGADEDYLVTAHDISFEDHIAVQAAIQKYMDSAVSKTINMPACATPAEIGQAYMLAWKSGCKGITVFKDESFDGVCKVCEA